MSKLEKQVQSRAEGSSKIIYFGQNHDYDDLVKCLLGKFYTPPGMNHCVTDEYDEHTVMLEIREEVDFILRGNGESDINRVNSEEDDNQFTDDFALVRRVLQRNYNLIGSDMRWVCRVFDVALVSSEYSTLTVCCSTFFIMILLSNRVSLHLTLMSICINAYIEQTVRC